MFISDCVCASSHGSLCARCCAGAAASRAKASRVAGTILFMFVRSGSRRGAFGLGTDEAAVIAALNPTHQFGDAPDGEGVRQAGVNHVGPEAVERLLVVVLLEVARLR